MARRKGGRSHEWSLANRQARTSASARDCVNGTDERISPPMGSCANERPGFHYHRIDGENVSCMKTSLASTEMTRWVALAALASSSTMADHFAVEHGSPKVAS